MLDPTGEEPLTTNHLLMLRSLADHSTEIFAKEDNYVRKRWRHVQYLVEQFWLRWRREYLQILQTRSKWQQPQTDWEIHYCVGRLQNCVVSCRTNLDFLSFLLKT